MEFPDTLGRLEIRRPPGICGMPTSPARAVQLANKAADKLDHYCLLGFPAVYKNKVRSVLSDWYPDLPWDHEGIQVVADHLLTVRAPTLDAFTQKFGFDMRKSVLLFKSGGDGDD